LLVAQSRSDGIQAHFTEQV